MIGKKRDSAQVDGAVAKAVNFELTIADAARRSERRAWWVATGSLAMSLMLGAGYLAILPLKERVPYMVMADAYTGTASVARLRENFEENTVTMSEAVNRSNVANFIIARESYDLDLQQLRDWTTVYTMSSPDVAAGYTTLHARNNPEAPYSLYGPGKSIRVKILSITLLGGDAQGSGAKGATVRFQRMLYEKQSGVTRPLDSKIATLSYTYKSNLKMSEEQRIANPLGFQVVSYRVDNDYAASPPSEVVVAPTPAQPQAAAPLQAAYAGGLPAAPGAAQAIGGASNPDAANPAATPQGPAPAVPAAQLPAPAVAPASAPAASSPSNGASR